MTVVQRAVDRPELPRLLRLGSLVAAGLITLPLVAAAVWSVFAFAGSDRNEPCPPGELCTEGVGLLALMVAALIGIAAIVVPLVGMQILFTVRRRIVGLAVVGSVLAALCLALGASLVGGGEPLLIAYVGPTALLQSVIGGWATWLAVSIGQSVAGAR